MSSTLVKKQKLTAGPERDLLLASLRLDPAGGEAISTLIRQELDWGALLKMAAFHEIVPLLYQGLSPFKADLDPQGWQALRGAYLENATRNVFLSKTLLQTLETLRQAGIEALALKGPALAVLVYGDLVMRQYVDLDILIQPTNFNRAADILTQNGWLRPFQLSDAQKTWLVRTENDLSFTRTGAHLELHWDVAEKGVRSGIPRDLWWTNVQPVELLERPVPTLSAENTFLYLCLHGCKHGWLKFKYLADLAYFYQASSGLDWEVVLQQARRLGLLRSVGLGVTLAQRFCGLALAPILSQSCQQAGSGSLADLVEGKLGAPQPSMTSFETVRFIARSKERLGDRCYVVLDQLFVPKQADWLEVSLPPAMGWLYYLVRPLRLAAKFVRAILVPRPKQS
jgi:hypothetical protein